MHPFKLPELTYPLKIDTIGKSLAFGEERSAHCRTYECGGNRTRRLNLVAIARRYGMDYPSGHDSLIRIVYCSECRAAGRPDRNIGFVRHQPTYPYSRWPFEKPKHPDVFKAAREPNVPGPHSPYHPRPID
ncbi:MAG: hypothetical protein AB7I52_03605 [Rhizobiaceae bacterium]